LSPEVETLEKVLACVIEGLENNQLLIRFTRIDESDLDREFSFILDVSSRSYKGSFLAITLSRHGTNSFSSAQNITTSANTTCAHGQAEYEWGH
jgi:hypothetical protein